MSIKFSAKTAILDKIVNDAVANATKSPQQKAEPKPGLHDRYVREWLGNDHLRALMDVDSYIASRCIDDGLPVPKFAADAVEKSEPANPLLSNGKTPDRYAIGSDHFM